MKILFYAASHAAIISATGGKSDKRAVAAIPVAAIPVAAIPVAAIPVAAIPIAATCEMDIGRGFTLVDTEQVPE